MLTAKTKSGNLICLGLDYKKETLLELRKKEEFLCPVCGESVMLKLGEQRIFHFAHKQGETCSLGLEGETVRHLEGKRQLYQWLIRQRIPSVLEYYDREIQQRPDVMFQYKGKKYALEYQCSTIPEKDFIKRTNCYLKHAYVPLWIVSSDHLKLGQGHFATLSSFNYLFLRNTTSGDLFIPAYCPENQLFHLVSSITPYSIKNSFASHSIFPLKNINLDGLLEPQLIDNQLVLSQWFKNLERTKFMLSVHANAKSSPFLSEIYRHYLNLFLLPPEIGLPVPHALNIQTPPLIWQTYLFIDIIKYKQLGDIITLEELNTHFYRRVNRKEIILRHLPQIKETETPLKPLLEYLHILVWLDILGFNKSSNAFYLKQQMVIPETNRQYEVRRIDFYNKYRCILKYHK
ncbi:competence protein CoiA [Neobacillus dielmonensis]|uniref:competence protein CoiA n=1 Tax=Neobacillus dielmonensis TaxID=1347369 RepID=UPI0005A93C46|nr:competence protein CoiA family protein [Neobacillus dielmonensis]